MAAAKAKMKVTIVGRESGVVIGIDIGSGDIIIAEAGFIFVLC